MGEERKKLEALGELRASLEPLYFDFDTAQKIADAIATQWLPQTEKILKQKGMEKLIPEIREVIAEELMPPIEPQVFADMMARFQYANQLRKFTAKYKEKKVLGIVQVLLQEEKKLGGFPKEIFERLPVGSTDLAGHIDFMKLAIAEAAKSLSEKDGTPKVGAVVVKEGAILATAHRGETGRGDHAEFGALEKKLKDQNLSGTTVYTTLEPCIAGRSENKKPCAIWLNERKIHNVYVGIVDPNPIITGRGIQFLSYRGIGVQLFPRELALEVIEQNREFIEQYPEGANAVKESL